ncbi:hypothetical protein [Coxiella-like endosymbiont]|uniref:hypothetical protein n=1 Tax=Coxiella-like endosymbiont TaxID=1592897 RepID=UPI0027295BAA|nr:hypothetical protein [Coxiella-like endosymbiont]
MAESLFNYLANYAIGQDIYLDITELNLDAMALVKRHNMNFVFETVRMYLQMPTKLPMQQICGLTTLELG